MTKPGDLYLGLNHISILISNDNSENVSYAYLLASVNIYSFLPCQFWTAFKAEMLAMKKLV